MAWAFCILGEEQRNSSVGCKRGFWRTDADTLSSRWGYQALSYNFVDLWAFKFFSDWQHAAQHRGCGWQQRSFVDSGSSFGRQWTCLNGAWNMLLQQLYFSLVSTSSDHQDILSEPPCWQYGSGQCCPGCLLRLALHRNVTLRLKEHYHSIIHGVVYFVA